MFLLPYCLINHVSGVFSHTGVSTSRDRIAQIKLVQFKNSEASNLQVMQQGCMGRDVAQQMKMSSQVQFSGPKRSAVRIYGEIVKA